MATINVNKPYKLLYTTDKHNIIANTPRASAKSYESAMYVAVNKIKHPDHDIVVFRANANSLEDSVVSEIIEKFEIIGIGGLVKLRKYPLRIEYACGRSFIYFAGVDGADKSRVRGFKPRHPLSLIMADECQQISDEQNLKHALTTYRRYFDTTLDDYKVLLCGNPHEVKGHWWNVYCEQHKGVKDYEYISATYKDIAKLLNKDILEDIELEKKINPALYRFMYLGDLSDISGGAYPSFRRERHLLTQKQADDIFNGQFIETVIIGVDGAITHDMTCCNCIAVMTDGRALVLEPFIFNPLTNGIAKAPSELADMIEQYIGDLESKYRFQENSVPVWIICDCASEDLITQLRYNLSGYYQIQAYTAKNVIRNVSTVNNVFARNMCYIVNYGGYKDYTSNKWVERDIPLLAEQLETVIWKNNKLDSAIPNDCSDSFTYGICPYYETPDALSLPERKKWYEN